MVLKQKAEKAERKVEKAKQKTDLDAQAQAYWKWYRRMYAYCHSKPYNQADYDILSTIRKGWEDTLVLLHREWQ